MKGDFSVSVPVESDLVPIARLLIYAILPDGEVVGDSAKYEVENCLANKVSVSYYKFFNIKTRSYYCYQLFSTCEHWDRKD